MRLGHVRFALSPGQGWPAHSGSCATHAQGHARFALCQPLACDDLPGEYPFCAVAWPRQASHLLHSCDALQGLVRFALSPGQGWPAHSGLVRRTPRDMPVLHFASRWWHSCYSFPGPCPFCALAWPREFSRWWTSCYAFPGPCPFCAFSLVVLMRCSPGSCLFCALAWPRQASNWLHSYVALQGRVRFALWHGQGRPALGGLLTTLPQRPIRFALWLCQGRPALSGPRATRIQGHVCFALWTDQGRPAFDGQHATTSQGNVRCAH